MSETLSVTLDESKDSAQPTLEQEAAKYDNLTPAGDRPEWLPEKFKSPEELAKAYQELQSKFSSRQQQPENGDEEPYEEDYVEEDGVEDESAEDQAREAVENAGLDFDELSNKFWETGELDDSDYDALESSGIPRHLVDQFIEGQKAIVDATRMQVFNSVGGEQAYQGLTEWAKDNLSDSEIDAFNRAVNSNDMQMTLFAVRGLEARYRAENGMEPTRQIKGETSRSGSDSYASLAEMQKDMSDPRYKNDPAFRNAVAAKLGRSNIM